MSPSVGRSSVLAADAAGRPADAVLPGLRRRI